LHDGIVVFLDFEGAWSETLEEAVVARSPDEARALTQRGSYDAARNVVVEPYLIEVHETARGLLPIRHRERVRAAGPSILADVPGYREPAAGRAQEAHERGQCGSTREAYPLLQAGPQPRGDEQAAGGMLAVRHPPPATTDAAHVRAL
jgi:hypothetical protein